MLSFFGLTLYRFVFAFALGLDDCPNESRCRDEAAVVTMGIGVSVQCLSRRMSVGPLRLRARATFTGGAPRYLAAVHCSVWLCVLQSHSLACEKDKVISKQWAQRKWWVTVIVRWNVSIPFQGAHHTQSRAFSTLLCVAVSLF